MDVEPRVAVVTGAASGIGESIAERLADDGYTVVLADVNVEGASRVASAINDRVHHGNRYTASPLRLDVSKEADVRGAIRTVLEQHGRLDALVCSAGVAGRSEPSWQLPMGEWERVLAVNLSGAFYCCRYAIPPMVEASFGRVVLISSIAGKEGNPNAAPYSAAKAGVIGLTKSIAKEVATTGVLVNCVTPAVIATPILSQVSDKHLAYMRSRIPMNRIGQPGEVAALVSWLCSRECSFSTGACFDISGGRATY